MANGDNRSWLRRILDFIFGPAHGPETTGPGTHEGPPPGTSIIAAAAPPTPLLSVGPLAIATDSQWADSSKMPLDANLRVALSLLELGNARLVFEQTGIRLPDPAEAAPKAVYLPLHIEVAKRPDAALLQALQSDLSLLVPPAYLAEAERNADLRSLTALMKLPVARGGGIDLSALRANVRRAIDHALITRMSLASRMAKAEAVTAGETAQEFAIPPNREVIKGGQKHTVDGNGVVIGIIDDGCAFAHWNFLNRGNPPTSRVRFLWDQDATPGGHWKAAPGFPYGAQIQGAAIDAALAANTVNGVVDEDAVYRAAGYVPYTQVENRSYVAMTHGTHVMDIAAGNGLALFGREGVAPKAEIVFVQLKRDLLAAGGAALTPYIQEAVLYVFQRAQELGAPGAPLPAVVNLSLANHVGPHDGTRDIELAMDTYLSTASRAIVIAAGNGFAAQCHARTAVTKARAGVLHWEVPPFDESMNVLDAWYTGAGDIEFYVTPPGGAQLGPIKATDPRCHIVDANDNYVGYVDHAANLPLSGDHRITVTLHPTATAGLAPIGPVAGSAKAVTAPAGTWTLTMRKPAGARRSVVHAWIERDVPRRADPARRRQSRFADGESDVRVTTNGMATGKRTIVVGAYNAATRELAEYTACGPTRRNNKGAAPRRKPDLLAPAAGDAGGRGVLSASTRFALATRLGGTSAATPHVTGLVALLMQLNRDMGTALLARPPLTIGAIRAALQKGTQPPRRVRANAHQAIDPHQPQKQSQPGIFKNIVGDGPVRADQTLK